MSYVEVTIPSKAKTVRDPSVSPEDMKEILAMLQSGKAVSDGKVYTDADVPAKSKMDTRNYTYYQGYTVRSEVIATGEFKPADLRLETFADGDGFRWALRQK